MTTDNTTDSPDHERLRSASTGLEVLDQMLGGKGLPRFTGICIEGPPNVGKRTLCMQFLFAALQRGEACIYVSYRHTWHRVLEKFSQFNWELSPYMNKGVLRIVDNASVLSGVDLDKEINFMSDPQKKAISFCKALHNPEAYGDFLLSHVRETTGSAGAAGPGIAVIDNVSARLDLIRDPSAASRYLQQFRVKLAEETGLTSLHIHTPTASEHAVRVRMAEGGLIELQFKEGHHSGRQRRLRVASMPFPHDDTWHRFDITREGIRVWDMEK